MHVARGVDGDERRDERDHRQHHGRQGVGPQRDVDAEVCASRRRGSRGRRIGFQVVGMADVGPGPERDDLLEAAVLVRCLAPDRLRAAAPGCRRTNPAAPGRPANGCSCAARADRAPPTSTAAASGRAGMRIRQLRIVSSMVSDLHSRSGATRRCLGSTRAARMPAGVRCGQTRSSTRSSGTCAIDKAPAAPSSRRSCQAAESSLPLLASEHQDQRHRDRRFAGGDGDDEDHEHLAAPAPAVLP